MAFVTDYFAGGYIHADINQTNLTLIPQVTAPDQMGDFRPISLSNFSAKVISKILAIRLSKILPRLVDEEQAGCIQDRNITSHCALAQELVRDINRKVAVGNVILKIDMAKAYDMLEWRFILHALKAFGFIEIARDLIYCNICNIRYSFSIKGELVGRVHCYRGAIRVTPYRHLFLFYLSKLFPQT